VPFCELTRLTKLESLEITSDESFDDANLALISSISSLTSLNLSGCGFEGRATHFALCKMLNSLQNLKHLDLFNFVFGNQIREEKLQHRGTSSLLAFRYGMSSGQTESLLIGGLKRLNFLEVLTLPSAMKDWESLIACPSLRYLCLAQADINHIFGGRYDAEKNMKEIDSWISRIDNFKAAVLFQASFGPKESLLCCAVSSGKLELVSQVLSAPRVNPSLAVNFSAFGGHTSIFNANTVEILTALVDAGANVNATSVSTQRGVFTPLRAMITTGIPSLVKVALECGADPFVGAPLVESMSQATMESFCLLWDRVKARIFEFGDKELADIVVTAFKIVHERHFSFYWDTLIAAIGEPTASAYVKDAEASLAPNYPQIWRSAGMKQLLHAVAAGINLRLPEGRIQQTAAWHLYVAARDDATRAFIKEKGILTETEIAAAESQRKSIL
jgi:hypothetical protein